jgi:hypothetical protein
VVSLTPAAADTEEGGGEEEEEEFFNHYKNDLERVGSTRPLRAALPRFHAPSGAPGGRRHRFKQVPLRASACSPRAAIRSLPPSARKCVTPDHTGRREQPNLRFSRIHLAFILVFCTYIALFPREIPDGREAVAAATPSIGKE